MTTQTFSHGSFSPASSGVAESAQGLFGRVWAAIAIFFEETYAANMSAVKRQPFGA